MLQKLIHWRRNEQFNGINVGSNSQLTNRTYESKAHLSSHSKWNTTSSKRNGAWQSAWCRWFHCSFRQSLLENCQKKLAKNVFKLAILLKDRGKHKLYLLSLIPKEKGATSFDRFRPILLCNIGYNIITKTMSNRLRDILPKLIPANQGGFVKGWKIMDNIILVQEAVHSILTQRKREWL